MEHFQHIAGNMAKFVDVRNPEHTKYTHYQTYSRGIGNKTVHNQVIMRSIAKRSVS